MKVAGRKTSSAYELYGFIPKVDKGKHTAICASCNRVLQNTAAVRLQKHRNSCIATRAASGDPTQLPEVKTRTAPIVEAVEENESINVVVKPEQTNIEFDDGNVDHANDNGRYDDPVEDKNLAKRSRQNFLNDETNIFTVSKKSKEFCGVLDQQENFTISSITTQVQSPELFEACQATTTTPNNSVLDFEDEIPEVNDEDLINVEEELDVIQNLMPRSRESRQLQDELSKAEINYYRCKSAYFAKLVENGKIKRTLMLLESRKLQLEIEKLTNES